MAIRRVLLFLTAATAVLVQAMLGVMGTPLRAQAAPAQAPAVVPVAPSTFDVVSIKPNHSVSRDFGGGLTATGASFTNTSLVGVIFMAYFQPFASSGVVGYPAWALDEHYDIVARVDEATAIAWQKLSVRQRQALARPMLQQMLADRCKLVAHLVPAEAEGYALVVGKRGVQMTPTKPGELYPDGALNSGDGAKVVPASVTKDGTIRFFNTTIEQLTQQISTGWIIRDETQLTGRYDFVIRQLDARDAEGNRISDPRPSDLWDISATGLELKTAKVPTQNLVIDHIERPSEN